MNTREKVLSELDGYSARLNAIADFINREFADVEERLRKSNVGIEHWVGPFFLRHHEPRGLFKIGWAKADGKWSIFIWQSNGEPIEAKSLPLTDCTRALRLLAYPHLDDLVSSITERVRLELLTVVQLEERMR